MGGSAFASKPYLLNTPRMPQRVYDQVKCNCHARLREVYVYVASPVEGPGKTDHGDVDVIVFLERQAFAPNTCSNATSKEQDPRAAIAVAVGAEHVIYLKDGANMAVPWPEAEGDNMSDVQERRYLQVDVHIAQSLAEFQWLLFRHAHGDLWQLIGTTIRPLGLTVDEEALWIRIPDIEARDRKRSKVLLTSDPDEVLQFMGYKAYLDAAPERPGNRDGEHVVADDDETSLPSVWDRPFNTVEDLFTYVITSSWFWINPSPPETPASPDPEPDAPSTAAAAAATVVLRSNDRRRLKQRRVYARWAEEYLPSLRDAARDGISPNTAFNQLPLVDKQSAVREAAFRRWPAAREDYRQRLDAFYLQQTIEKQQREVMACIRETVAGFGMDRNWSGVAASALKKIVFTGDAGFGILPEVVVRNDNGVLDVAEAEKFVREMGRLVGEKAWEIMCARGRKAMKDKARTTVVLAETQGETTG
jgi:hypothetical protein